MITSENVRLILSGGAMGATLIDATGAHHKVVGFGHSSIDLSVNGRARESYSFVTSGPSVAFYNGGVKHEALSSPDARFEPPLPAVPPRPAAP